MCIAVIKHVPLPINTLNAAVIGACGIQPVPFPSTLITYIAIGNNGSAINKRPVRVRTCGITKLMALTGGINKIIGTANLPDGASLKERMFLKGGPLYPAGQYVSWLRYNRQHIVSQNHMVCAHNPVRTGSNLCDGFAEQLAFNLAENGLQQFPVLIKGIPCSVVEPNHAGIIDHGRIEGDICLNGAGSFLQGAG